MIADCETCDRKQVPCSSCRESQRAICFICQGDVADPYCELQQRSPVATLPLPTIRTNPFEAARLRLIAALGALKAPAAYPAYPSPDDHEGIAAHLREAAAIFDEWLAAVGHEVRDNATTGVSHNLFNGSFSGAIEGNETWACEEAGIEVRWNRTARRA